MMPMALNTRVYLCTEAVDMRKHFDGLYGLAKTVLEEDPLSGALFVFMNRRRDYVKVLYHDRGGLCLWSKRLELGTFEALRAADDGKKRALSMAELTMLIDGVKVSGVEHRRRLVM